MREPEQVCIWLSVPFLPSNKVTLSASSRPDTSVVNVSWVGAAHPSRIRVAHPSRIRRDRRGLVAGPSRSRPWVAGDPRGPNPSPFHQFYPPRPETSNQAKFNLLKLQYVR